MHIIHGVQFKPEQLLEYQFTIYLNVIKGLQVLLDAREKLEIPWEHPNSSPTLASQIIGIQLTNIDQFAKYVPIVSLLWQDRAIKRAYDRRREFQIVSEISQHAGDN